MKTSGPPSLPKICVLLLMFLSYTDTYVFSKPRGGQVVSGTASFTQDGNLTVITAANRSIIDYQSFDISKNETVQFVQPGAHATVLNRVLTPDPTNIFGHLEANGIVIISNPYGVFFQNGSVVNVGGLVAGAGRISDASFTAGKIHFTDLTGDVRNDGVIAADNQIALMGANVVNTGSLNAMHGMAMMVSGPDVYVGDKNGNIFVQANGKALKAAGTTGVAGVAGSVTNRGTVAAPRVLLGAGDMYSTAIVNSGLLQGRSVAVSAGKNGSVALGGKVDATSASNPTSTGLGGNITVTGGTVALQAATLDASGAAGGGNIRVGGDFHGGGTLPQSATTTADAATTLKADATGGTGTGGTVVLWSNQATDLLGTVSARGGTAGGDGGAVEVSSHGGLGFAGHVDTAAPNGRTGSLLLDPTNIEITAGGAVDAAFVTNPVANANTTPALPPLTITQTSLQTTTAAINLTATNDIRIDTMNGGGLTLAGTANATFVAGGNGGTGSFVMNDTTQSITNAGHGISITANGASVAGSGFNSTFATNAGAAIAVGNLNTANTAALGTNGGAVALNVPSNTTAPVRVTSITTDSSNGNAGTITIGGTTFAGNVNAGALSSQATGNGGATTAVGAGGQVKIDSAGQVKLTGVASGGPPVVAGSVVTTSAGGAAGSILIGTSLAPSSITTSDVVTAQSAAGNGGAVTLASTGAITVGGALNTTSSNAAGGSINISAGGNVQTGNLNAGSAVSTTAAGGVGNVSVTTTTGTIAVNNVTTTSASGPGGTITLGDAAATGVTTGSAGPVGGALSSKGSTTGGAISLLAAGPLTVYGAIDSSTTGAGAGGAVSLTTAATAAATTTDVATAGITTTSTGGTGGAVTISRSSTTTLRPTDITVGAITTTGTGTTNGGAIDLETTGLLTLATATPVFTGNTTLVAGTTNATSYQDSGYDFALTLTGAPVLLSSIVDTMGNQPRSITLGGQGTTVDVATFTTSGLQTYNAPVTVSTNAQLTSSTASITFGSTVDSSSTLVGGVPTTTNKNLDVEATAANAIFQGTVGVNFTLGNLTANGGVNQFLMTLPSTGTAGAPLGGVNLSGAFTSAHNVVFNATGTASQTAPTIITGGLQSITGTTTVTTSTYLTSGTTLSLAAVNGTGTQALTLNTGGKITLGNVIGGASAATALGSFKTVGGQEVDLNGGSVRTNTAGGQSYSGAVVLGANTTVTAANGPVGFSSTLDGAFALTINATLVTTFGGNVGSAMNEALTSLNVSNGGTKFVLTSGAAPLTVTTTGTDAVTSNGQTYTGAVTLGSDTTLNAGTAPIDFVSTVASTVAGGATTAYALTATTTGLTTFGGAVGGADTTATAAPALASVVVTNAAQINGTSVTTTGVQNYGSLTLAGTAGALTTLAATGPSASIISGAITGAGHPLTVSQAAGSGLSQFAAITGAGALNFTLGGQTNFTGAITATSVSFGGPQSALVFTGPSVQTSAGQTYGDAGNGGLNGALVLEGPLALTDTGGGNITFSDVASKVASQSLSVSTGGLTTFRDTVGSIGGSSLDLLDLKVGLAGNANLGGTVQLNGGTVATNGTNGQTYNDKATLGADATLTSNFNAGGGTGGDITFNNTVDSATATTHALTINTSGNEIFAQLVGSTHPLTSLSTDTSGTVGGELKFNMSVVGQAAGVAGVSLGTGGLTAKDGTVFNVAGSSSAKVPATISGDTGTNNPSITSTGSAAQTYSGGVIDQQNTVIQAPSVVVAGTFDAGNKALTFDVSNQAISIPLNLPGTNFTNLVSVASVGDAGTKINGNITTSGYQYYGSSAANGGVTLAADATLTSSGGSVIGFGGTINGAHNLTINTAGNELFSGLVGNTTALTSLTTDAAGTVGGTALFNMDATGLAAGKAGVSATTVLIHDAVAFNVTGTVAGTAANAVSSVRTSNEQVYFGLATLGQDTVLTDTSLGIEFNATVNGTHNLTLNASGEEFFLGRIGDANPLLSLTTNGGTAVFNLTGTTVAPTVITVNNVAPAGTATGGQTYNSAILLTGDTVLSSTFTGPATGGGAITFNGTVDSTGGARSLTALAGPGQTVFASGATVAAAGVNISGAQVTFNQPVGSNGSLNLLTVGRNGTGATSSIALNNGGFTTSTGEIFNDPVTLGATTLLTDTGSSAITFASTLQSAGTTTPQALTIATGGVTTFDGAVGGTPGAATTGVTTAPALASLNITGSGAVDVKGGSVTTVTSGAQSYGGQVVLGADTVFQGGSGTFTGGITSSGAGAPFNLTLDFFGLTTLPVTGTLTGVRDLLVEGPGGVALDGAITTAGNQKYINGVVTITADTTLTAGNTVATGSIEFDSNVINGTPGTHNLTLVTGTAGGVTIAAPVGTAVGGASAPLASLTATARTTNGSAPTTDEPVTIKATSVTTTGAQTYGSITLGGTGATTLNSTAAAGSITSGAVTGGVGGHAFNVNVTGAGGTTNFAAIADAGAPVDFEVAGTATFAGTITASAFTLGATTPGTTGVFSAGGNTVTTTGDQNYAEPIELANDTILASSNGGAINLLAVTTDGTLRALTTSTAGTTTYGGALGTMMAPLASVTAGLAGINNLGGNLKLNGGAVYTQGPQTYNDPVTLGAAGASTSLSAVTGAVTFAQTLASAGTTPQALSIDTSGTTTFDDQVGGAPGAPGTDITAAPALASLTTTGGGEVDIAKGVTTITTTGGSQSYSGQVKLLGDVTLEGNSLALTNGVDGQSGAHSLTLDFTTQTTLNLNAIVGLNNFTANGSGGVLLNGGTLSTKGTQTYSNGAVTLGANAILKSTGANLVFNTPVDGPFTLTLSALGATGTVTFHSGAQVGNVAPLVELASNSTAGTIFGMDATALGGVNAAAVATSGPVTFQESGAASAKPDVLTTSTQSYASGAVTLGQDTFLTSTGTTVTGGISFGTSAATAATIDSALATAHSLTLSTLGTQTFYGVVGATTALSGLTTGTGETDFLMTIPMGAPAGVRVAGPLLVNGASVFDVGGSTDALPSVLTLGTVNNTQTYVGVVTLGTATDPNALTVLNSAATDTAGTFAGGGSIAFQNAIQSAVGGATPELDVFAGEGATVFDGSVTTTGAFPAGGANVTFGGDVGPLGTFVVQPNTNTGAGSIDLNGPFYSALSFPFSAALVLSHDVALSISGGGTGGITFGTVEGGGGAFPGPFALTLNLSGGNVTFNGVVGNTVPLASLTINDSGATKGTTTFQMSLVGVAANRGGVSVLGVTGAPAVTIGDNVVFAAVGAAGGTVPTILTGLTYGAQVGTGGQTYNGTVTVGATAALLQDTVLRDVAAAGDITFNGLVDATAAGAGGLSVNSNGDEVFAGLVGSVNSLASLSTDGVSGGTGATRFNMTLTGATAGVQVGTLSVNDRVAFNATGGTTIPTVLSSGAQSYALAATVRQNTVLTATSGNITFDSTVDSGATTSALTVNTPGNEVFDGAVGSLAPLLSLTTDDPAVLTPAAGQVVFAFAGVGPSVVTSGAQTYHDAALLKADTILTSNGDSILFASTIDSDSALTARALTLNAALGNETFQGRVGGIFPLASLATDAMGGTGNVIFDVVGGSTAAVPGVTTNGAQTYNDAALLQTATVLASRSAGTISFNQTVDGAQALTLNTMGDEVFNGAVGDGTALTSLVTDDPAGMLVGGRAIFNVPGSTIGAPSVKTSGAQTYNDAVLLDANTVLTSTGSGSLTFKSTVDGAHALSVNSMGDELFRGRVGTLAAPLSSLTTDADPANRGGRTVFSFAGTNAVPSVATAGAQTYNDAVFLGAPVTLASTAGGGITFVLTVDSLSAVAPQDLTVNTAGATIFGGQVGGMNPLASVTTDSEGVNDLGTQINGGSVRTMGAQSYLDSVTLGMGTTLTSSGGNILFGATVDSDALAPRALTVNASGDETFQGRVGGIHPLASLVTDATGASGHVIFAVAGGSTAAVPGVTTIGAQTYNDAALLQTATVLASTGNGALTFNRAVDGAFALTLDTGGVTQFNGVVGNSQALASLTTDNAGVAGEATVFNMAVGSQAGVVVNGPVTINDAVVFAVTGASAAQPSVLTLGNANQTYNGPASVNTNTYLVSAASPAVGGVFTGGGGVFFNSLSGISNGGPGTSGLFVRSAVGTTTLAAAVHAASADLGGASATFAGPVNLSGAFSVQPNDASTAGIVQFGGGIIQTVGAQTYGAFVLTNDAVLTSTGAGDIAFGGRVDGAHNLTVNTMGDEIFNGRVGGLVPLTSLATDSTQLGGHVIFAVAGTTASPSVVTTGTQTYHDAALLRQNTVLASTALGGGITFVSTVDSDTGGPFALTLNSVGNQLFDGQVGGVGALASLTTDDPTSGLAGGSVSFAIAGTPSVTTTGDQTYNNPAVLLADSVFTSSNHGTLIFANTVNGAFNLTVTSAGNEIFGAPVGNTTPLTSLTTDAGITAGGQTIFGTSSSTKVIVITTGAQTYHDAVLLATDTNLGSNTGANLTFDRTVEGDFALTLNTNLANPAAPGTIILTGAVGGDGNPLASLTTKTGTVAINGGAVTTIGAQTYGLTSNPGNVTLGADAILASTAGGALTFNNKVDSTTAAALHALTVSTTGPTTFGQALGGNIPLAALTTTGGPVAIDGGAVTTTGAQNYGGAVTLGSDAVLSNTTTAASDGSGILFTSTLDSDTATTPRNLVLNAVGNEVFGGSVGTVALKSLVTNALAGGATTGRVIFGNGVAALSVTTTDFQTYNNAVELKADSTLVSTGGGTLTFASTVNGPFVLTLNSAGDETFNGQLGGNNDPLAKLITDADSRYLGGNVNFNFLGSNGSPSVTTIGDQTYHDAAVLLLDTVLASKQQGTLTFGSTIDNGRGTALHSLTLNTAGNEVFSGLIGSKRVIGDLTTDAAGTVGGKAIFNADLSTANGAPVVNVAGTVTINDAVSFNVTNATPGEVTVQTTGAQNYVGAATVDRDALLLSTGNNLTGAVTFSSPVDGPGGLTVSTAGPMTLENPVGQSVPLGSLTLEGGGGIALNAGSVHTTGDQVYDGVVALPDQSATTLQSDAGNILFTGTVSGSTSVLNVTTADTATATNATTFDQAVNLANFTATDGSNVNIAGTDNSITTSGLQTYGGAVAVVGSGTTTLTATNTAITTDARSGGIIFRQAVNVADGNALTVQATRILAGSDIVVTGAGNLDLEASDLLVLEGSNYTSGGAIKLNTSFAGTDGESKVNPTIVVANGSALTRFRGATFSMGYLQNLFAQGSVSITATNGTALLSDIAVVGSLTVVAPSITLFARSPDGMRGAAGGGTDDGLNFVAGSSINFGQSTPIRYDTDISSNKVANFVTPSGLVTVNRNQENGISIFQDSAALVTLRADAAKIGEFTRSNDFTDFLSGSLSTGAFAVDQPISGGTQTIDTAAALSGALPDQKPLDVASDITISASQLEELLKLGIHPRKAQKQERLSLASKRALFAQLVDGLDKDNYGRLQPIKGGISTLVPSDYVVVVDRMSEHEVQAILTAFEDLYGKNKEKVPPIGEAFNTAFTDYSTEKQTADPNGLAPYITSKPGKYPNVDKAVRGFDNLFGFIEHLGLTEKEQAKAKEHIASDLEVSGVSADDMVKVIDTLRTKIPKDQKAASTKLPASAPAGSPAPGRTSPGQPEQKKGTPPLKSADHAPADEDRGHEVAGL